jgi:hypothetical protein
LVRRSNAGTNGGTIVHLAVMIVPGASARNSTALARTGSEARRDVE